MTIYFESALIKINQNAMLFQFLFLSLAAKLQIRNINKKNITYEKNHRCSISSSCERMYFCL